MRNILVLLMLLCSINMFAQDVIVKKDGSTIVCRVIELNDSEIIYKKWSDLNGSNYVMDKSLASAINYENGKKVSISEMNNVYMPNNQNTGIQQYNDKALLALDANLQRKSISSRTKVLKLVGLIGGSVLLTTGGIVMYAAGGDGAIIEIGAGITGCGIIGATACFLKANSYKKQYERLQTSAIYQQDFILPNNSTLHAGLDMISDRSRREKTLGLGLCYKF